MANKTIRVAISVAKSDLYRTLNEVTLNQKTVILTRHGHDAVAVISMGDFHLLQGAKSRGANPADPELLFGAD